MSFNILIDFEATSIKPAEARPIEVGLCIVDEKWNHVLSHSGFIYQDDYPKLSQEVQDITGIDPAILQLEGTDFAKILTEFGDAAANLLPQIKYVIAYNREYDETLFKAESLRVPIGMTKAGNLMLQLPWLCAMRDIEKNHRKKCWTQSHLALDYGIAVDPKELHRAISDVYLMRKILAHVDISADDIYSFQREPTFVLQALIPTPWSDGGAGRDAAKKVGYSWEKVKGSDTVYPKAWVKGVKERALDDEIKSAPFKVQIMKENTNG